MDDFTKSLIGPWYEERPSKFKMFLHSYWRWIVISIAFCMAFFEGDYYRKQLWPEKEPAMQSLSTLTYTDAQYATFGTDSDFVLNGGTASSAIMLTSSAGGISIEMTDDVE